MKKLVQLVRISSKEAFLKLRDLGEIHCNGINRSFSITNLFLRHISGSSKNREIEEIIERLSCINLVQKISQESQLVETRENVIVEGKRFFRKTYKVQSKIKSFNFFLILGEKKDGKIILVSIFFNFFEK